MIYNGAKRHFHLFSRTIKNDDFFFGVLVGQGKKSLFKRDPPLDVPEWTQEVRPGPYFWVASPLEQWSPPPLVLPRHPSPNFPVAELDHRLGGSPWNALIPSRSVVTSQGIDGRNPTDSLFLNECPHHTIRTHNGARRLSAFRRRECAPPDASLRPTPVRYVPGCGLPPPRRRRAIRTACPRAFCGLVSFTSWPVRPLLRFKKVFAISALCPPPHF